MWFIRCTPIVLCILGCRLVHLIINWLLCIIRRCTRNTRLFSMSCYSRSPHFPPHSQASQISCSCAEELPVSIFTVLIFSCFLSFVLVQYFAGSWLTTKRDVSIYRVRGKKWITSDVCSRWNHALFLAPKKKRVRAVITSHLKILQLFFYWCACRHASFLHVPRSCTL